MAKKGKKINSTSIVFAYIYSSDIPSRDTWQESIDELNVGANLELGSTLDPLRDGSTCTCVLNAKAEQIEEFELYNGQVEWENVSDKTKYSKLAQDRDFYLMFKSSGTVGSNLSICIACQALIECFNAVISYEGLNDYVNRHLYDAIEILVNEYNT